MTTLFRADKAADYLNRTRLASRTARTPTRDPQRRPSICDGTSRRACCFTTIFGAFAPCPAANGAVAARVGQAHPHLCGLASS
jgi:hypothetical protein